MSASPTEDGTNWLPVIVVVLLGFWTLVYLVWECAEDVMNEVWASAADVVHREVYHTFVEPLLLRKLRVWHWTAGRRPRHVFAEVMGFIVLDPLDALEFEARCLASLRSRHRLVPTAYLRRCIAQMAPTYVFHNHTIPHLWTYLMTAYNAG